MGGPDKLATKSCVVFATEWVKPCIEDVHVCDQSDVTILFRWECGHSEFSLYK